MSESNKFSENKYSNLWEKLSNDEKLISLLTLAKEYFGNKIFATGMLTSILPFETPIQTTSQLLLKGVREGKIFKRVVPSSISGSLNLTVFSFQNSLSDEEISNTPDVVLFISKTHLERKEKQRPSKAVKTEASKISENDLQLLRRAIKSYGNQEYVSQDALVRVFNGTIILNKLIQAGKIKLLNPDEKATTKKRYVFIA